MKKFFSLLALLALVATVATGCNKPADNQPPAAPEAPGTNAPAPAAP
jgi:hypothetical protein